MQPVVTKIANQKHWRLEFGEAGNKQWSLCFASFCSEQIHRYEGVTIFAKKHHTHKSLSFFFFFFLFLPRKLAVVSNLRVNLHVSAVSPSGLPVQFTWSLPLLQPGLLCFCTSIKTQHDLRTEFQLLCDIPHLYEMKSHLDFSLNSELLSSYDGLHLIKIGAIACKVLHFTMFQNTYCLDNIALTFSWLLHLND